ncbi:MAG TPA: hypothetical protein VKX17_13445 [Planctomycetota bacterium]|nr:hypothetical protein [Planctomycetota bacterium]
MKRRSENFRYPHSVECAIRGIASGSSACQKLATFLIEQQKPDFDSQGHLFVEAADEFKKALNWAERAKQKP